MVHKISSIQKLVANKLLIKNDNVNKKRTLKEKDGERTN